MPADPALPSKLELEQVALTTARAYHFACSLGELSDADWETEQPAWENAAAWGIRLYADNLQDDALLRMSDVVIPFVRAVTMTLGIEEEYANLDAVKKLQWDAACRHLFGAITCDPGEDSDAAERSWEQWVTDRYHAAVGSNT